MKIEDLNVTVRPRTPWESVDLGIRMIQQNLAAVYIPWLLALMPLFLLVFIPQLSDLLWLFFLVLWWLKPLFGRIPLFVLSRTMFGHKPSARETLAAFKSLLHPAKLGGEYLLIYRFSPNRAVHQPVFILEDAPPEKRNTRTDLISKRLGNMPFWVSFAFLIFEFIMVFSLFTMTMMMIPDDVNTGLFEPGVWHMETMMFLVFYFVTVALLEPIYVAACFALYLNCRTITEGWDLELAFRRMRNRILSQKGLGLLLLTLGLGWFGPDLLQAQTPPQDPAQVIEDILADPVFSREETVEELQFKDFDLNASPEAESSASDLTQALAALSQLLGALFYPIVWGLLILFVVFVLVQFIRFRPHMSGPDNSKNKPAEKPAPKSRFVQELMAQPMPDDIVGAAQEQMAAGDARGALGLLFRGALKTMAARGDLKISDHATEMECVDQVKAAVEPDFGAFFTRLVRAWLQIAYAHNQPEADEFQSLCSDWRRFLGEPS